MVRTEAWQRSTAVQERNALHRLEERTVTPLNRPEKRERERQATSRFCKYRQRRVERTESGIQQVDDLRTISPNYGGFKFRSAEQHELMRQAMYFLTIDLLWLLFVPCLARGPICSFPHLTHLKHMRPPAPPQVRCL
jgi:hypothetical protein